MLRINSTAIRRVERAGRASLGLRSIFISSDTKRRKRKTEKLAEWAKDDTLRSEMTKELEFKKKLKEIYNLTASVSRMIQKKEDKRKQQDLVSKLPMPSQLEKEVDQVYKALKNPGSTHFDASKSTLLTPVVDIPQEIQHRLGLSVRYLVSQENQNWPLVLQTLQLGGGFKDLLSQDVRKFIYSIPRTHLPEIIAPLRLMMEEAGVKATPKVLNIFIESLNTKKSVSLEVLSQIDKFTEEIRSQTKGKTLPKKTFELLISVYGKVNDMEKINELLLEMKNIDIKPTPNIYSNILTSLVYKAKNHKEAVSIFDSMKFLSQETKPGTSAYRDVIVSYINDDDIEKALDLYQEMVTSKTPINQQILVALARGCSSRKELRFKAWDFMFEIYDNNWTPQVETLEYMIYLASKDGDLALSRTFYGRLFSKNAASKRSFNFLLMAYAKSRALKDYETPISITTTERGRNFRVNLLSKPAVSQNSDAKLMIPFLPLLDLETAEQILAESSALWAHTLMFNPEFINTDSYNSYLNIVAEFGTLDDLKDRYAFSILVEDAPTNSTRVIIEEDSNEVENEQPDVSKSPILDEVTKRSGHIKVTRTTLTYIIALKGAGRLRDFKFAQEIWAERGKYRKSSEFKALPKKEKEKLDFQFANAMVQSLTTMNLLDDALAIIVSTEYQFKWSWIQLDLLYKKCVEIGNDKHCQTLRSIARRAQYKYEGKIRRRDYKEFVMKRGF